MSNSLKDNFHYTSSERNGFILLLLAIIIFALVPKLFRTLYPSSKISPDVNIENIAHTTDKTPPTKVQGTLFPFDPNTANKADFVKLGLSPKVAETILKYREKGGKFKTKQDLKKIYTLEESEYLRIAPYIELEQTTSRIPKDIPRSYDNMSSTPARPESIVFPFDPNTASKEQFTQLGLSERVINTILKFRAKGRFRKASDFAKIFGLSQSDFNRLLPYIKIEKPTKITEPINPKQDSIEQQPTAANKKTYKKVILDVNIAAAEEWQLLSGIGPTYAKRIVELREDLGGFYTIDQVAEVYGLPDSTFQKIRPQLQLENPTVQKLNINTASSDDLKKHKYLNWRQAQIIVNYRENHGAYKSLDDLQKIRAFDADFIAKITPYLEL